LNKLPIGSKQHLPKIAAEILNTASKNYSALRSRLYSSQAIATPSLDGLTTLSFVCHSINKPMPLRIIALEKCIEGSEAAENRFCSLTLSNNTTEVKQQGHECPGFGMLFYVVCIILWQL
jgi:hypothetical protein